MDEVRRGISTQVATPLATEGAPGNELVDGFGIVLANISTFQKRSDDSQLYISITGANRGRLYKFVESK